MIPTNLQSITNSDPVNSSLKKYDISNNIQLNSVFQPNQLSNLLDDPGVTEKLLPLIPASLRPQGKKGIQQVLNSESFQQLVHRLQQGLEMGAMSPLTVSLNLGVNSGRGVAQLVSSIQSKADKQWEKEVEKRKE
ncbi:hypothetical protein K502DRAFT_325229 [Neoconidiobolus thromboides FSU 785]|nr:hypothetical protein K502DRAFT_325229 [Neoconidiobolus thromboides FSU 785]